MKGRKPKDLALRILNGNAGKRALPNMEGSPFTVGLPEKPTTLDPVASQVWDELTEALAPVLSPASGGMLLCAVNAASEMAAADAVIQRHGLTYTVMTREGAETIRIRPEVKIRNAARQAYVRALAELGASPVASTRVRRLPEKKTASEKLTTGAFFTS